LKRLYLLRHAKSSWDDRSVEDFQRVLNERGERDVPVMGRRFRKRGFVPDLIVSSPAVRAWTTAEIVARELGYAVADIVTEQRLYLADTAILLATVRRADDAARSLMLIGHNPGLTDFANSLTPDRRIDNLPTTGLFVVDFPVDRWREISPGAASFVAFDAPKNRPGS
jgi:phosphohistidine phosphatase